MSDELTPRTVLNPDIAPQTLARLLRRHDPDRGVVVCHPVPPGPRVGQLALDVLHALGKHPTAPDWTSGRETAEHYTRIWLQAEQISDLLLVRADLFAPGPLDELVSLAREAGTRTWLIFDDAARQRATAELLKACPEDQVRLRGATKTRRRRTTARARPWSTPSPWLARAAAARAFTVPEFNDLDARMYAAFKATSAYLSAQRWLQPGTLERVVDVLATDALARNRHARLLGATYALLQHGFAAEIHERPSARKTIAVDPASRQAIEIRRHSSPANAALHVVAAFTDLDVKLLETITLDQIIHTSTGTYLAGYHLRGAAAAALRAHQAFQQSQGHAPSEPLFTQRQLTSHHGPWGRGKRAPSTQVEVKLAALKDSLDIGFPKPTADANFDAPRKETQEDAAVILRLLRLSPSRAFALARFTRPEKAAARRLSAVCAAKVYRGGIAASDHLRFSQFLSDTAKYIAGRTDPWP